MSTPVSQDNVDEYLTRPEDGMTMVHVPGGTFQMGSAQIEVAEALALCQQYYPTCNRWYYQREEPQHPVSLDSFWIDQIEISNAQYRLCVEAGICAQPSTCQDFRLAVVFTRSTYPYEKVPWPANLDDDCIKPTPGGFPATLAFAPEKWGTLTLTNPGE
jgi:formylglycine-generating enzyme required for sulfatase activity